MKTASLATFDAGKQAVKENQVVILNSDTESRWVVYKIENDPRWGYTYHVVSLEDPHFDNVEKFTPWREKFGTGWYYDDEQPEFMDAFEVAILRSHAQVKACMEEEDRRKADERIKQLEAIGRERLQSLIPADARATIVAELHEDDSDSMTDYFGYHITRTVILGFSRHTRDLFAEMRKYASHFEGTACLAEYNADYEHREKYAMGAGYYLGGSRHSGWCIKKEQIGDRERFIERYARIAGEEENICVKVQRADNTIPQTPDTIRSHFLIVDYSEKALAVFGDTRAVKDELKALGGRFNPKLSHEGGKRAGWIFSKSKENELRDLLTIK